jgi:hypothetical protein
MARRASFDFEVVDGAAVVDGVETTGGRGSVVGGGELVGGGEVAGATVELGTAESSLGEHAVAASRKPAVAAMAATWATRREVDRWEVV